LKNVIVKERKNKKGSKPSSVGRRARIIELEVIKLIPFFKSYFPLNIIPYKG